MSSALPRDEDGTYPAYAWPGGYPIVYFAADGAPLCPRCANGNGCEDVPVASDVYYEGPPLECAHCYAEIESAYGDPDDT